MATGSTKFWTWIATGVLSVVIVVLLNLALAPVRVEIDLTKDQRFTLPDAARRVAGKVADTLIVTNYVSEDLPSYLRHLPRVLRTRLDEFRDASDKRIEIEFVDPKDDAEMISNLKARKIEPVQLQDRAEGRISVGQWWLTMAFRYGDQETTLNLLELGQLITNPEQLSSVLPYLVSSRIVRLLNPEATVGFASEKKVVPAQLLQQIPRLQQLYGQNPTDGIAQVRTRLESRYPRIHDVMLKGGTAVPPDVETLVVYRPEGLSDREVFELDQFLMQGRNVIVLLESSPFMELDQLQKFQEARQQNQVAVRKVDHRLSGFLAHYGVLVSEGWVADTSNAKIQYPEMKTIMLNQGGRQIPLNMPTGKMLEEDVPGYVTAWELGEGREATGQFAGDSPLVAGLGQVTMVYPVPMNLDPAAKDRHPEYHATELLRTTREAWVEPIGDAPLPFFGVKPKEGAERGSRVLAAHVRGRFRSFFAGKDMPPRVGPDGTPLPGTPEEEAARARLDESTAPGQLVVFADSDFLQDLTLMGLLGQAPLANQGVLKAMAAFTNALDTVTLGEDLAEIRRPTLIDLAVREKEVEEDRGKIVWWAVGFAPVLLVALGIVWWIARSVITRVPSPTRVRTVTGFAGRAGDGAAAVPRTVAEEPEPAGAAGGDHEQGGER